MKTLLSVLACAAAFLQACSPAEDAPAPGPAAPIAAARNRSDLDALPQVRVAMIWDESTGAMRRRIDGREYADDAALQQAIADAHDAWVKKGKPDAPVTIDADARVPWSEITNVVNIIKRCGIQKIEFAMGAPPQKTAPK